MLPLVPAPLLEATRSEVGRMLRADALNIGLGLLLLGLGLTAVLV
jgi:hypothetical protein